MQHAFAERKIKEFAATPHVPDPQMMFLRLLLSSLRKKATPRAATADPLSALTLEQYESVVPTVTLYDGTMPVSYCTPNAVTKLRADTFFSKEPDTIEWIRTFSPGDVLVDVGANVGMYTIWAAKTRAARVYAFEPESQNYAVLYRNIVMNDLVHLVTGYCAALSDEERFSLLHLSLFQLGGSCHTFGEAQGTDLQPRQSRYTQGCFSTSLDALVDRGVVPVPEHIKIDVDGLEHKVIAGCRETLAHPRVKSVQVEINTNLAEHRAIIGEMGALGYSHSEQQVAAAQRREGPFKGTGNYVFQR